jgi:hypothetical protein
MNNIQMQALFDHLEQELTKHGCNHSRDITEDWLSDNCRANAVEVLTWLDNHGGYCDCEVMYNAEPQWDEKA